MNRTATNRETRIAALFVTGVFLFLSVISGCATAPPAENVHTSYNLWYTRPERISSVNYMNGKRIAAGTLILNHRVEGSRIHFETERGQFSIHFGARYHPGLSIHDFSARLFTPRDFGALTQGLNEKEIRAVRRGAVIKGMSKEAVLIALGPPPEHKTPGFESDTWIYWVSRHGKKVVTFDANGKVKDGF